MKQLKKIVSIVFAMVMLVSVVLTGCSSKDATTTTTTTTEASGTTTEVAKESLKPVELNMYLIGSPARDYEEVLTKLNEKLKADINATVTVNWIGWGDFGTKYPLVLASGEPIDLIYTSTWLGYFQQAQKGAFLPLEEMGPKYAPLSFAAEPAEGLTQATVDGHIYALPPNYIAYATYGTVVRGDLLEQYAMDPIKNLDDYGTYMDAVTKNNTELDPSGMYATQTPMDGLYFYQQNLYPLSGDVATQSPFWIDFTDENGQVVNIVDKADLPDMLAKFYDWSNKSYWPKSVLSNKDNEMLRNGKSASLIHNLDTWVGNAISHPEYDLQYTTMLANAYPLPMMQDGMAIPASSENPERALMMLELLRTDQSYYNLLTYGIEGKHYEITAEGLLNPLDQEGFTPEGYCSWGFRDTTFRYDMVGSPSTLTAAREAIKANAKTNIYTMFNLNIDPIKNEYASVLNVMQQYYVPLKLGYVEPVKGLEELKAQLNSAGVEKVQAEIQKQIDEFRAANAQ